MTSTRKTTTTKTTRKSIKNVPASLPKDAWISMDKQIVRVAKVSASLKPKKTTTAKKPPERRVLLNHVKKTSAWHPVTGPSGKKYREMARVVDEAITKRDKRLEQLGKTDKVLRETAVIIKKHRKLRDKARSAYYDERQSLITALNLSNSPVSMELANRVRAFLKQYDLTPIK